jgi:VIT1/CCC1 family predicted Fe2+/Mn2+ transporter
MNNLDTGPVQTDAKAEPGLQSSRTDRRRMLANLQDETDGAAIYDALAQGEKDEKVSAVYTRLATVERRHAAFWRDKLKAGGHTEAVRPSGRARLLAFIGRRFGPSLVLPTLARDEVKGGEGYSGQADAVAAGFHKDERSHARVIQAAASQVGGLSGGSLAQLEGRHKAGGGNALRAAVLGANDGLVSNLSLVMGVAGAAVSGRAILLTGLAGLVAGSCSMAMGEWLSVNSAREMHMRQIAAEKEELDAAPDLEKEELRLIYQAKGLDEAAATSVVNRIFSDKDVALDALVREELGIDPQELGGSAWAAAGSSFALFAIGAIFPVSPFLFSDGWTAIALSIGFSGVALGLIGSATSLFTGRSLAFSAARQIAIGYAAALFTFAVGRMIGVRVS